MLPVSLDCPFLIASSVFSNVYLHTKNKRIGNKTCSNTYILKNDGMSYKIDHHSEKNPTKYVVNNEKKNHCYHKMHSSLICSNFIEFTSTHVLIY